MALGTALSRLTGFLRLAAMAYALGFTRLTDTYNLANTTPNIVYELLLGGVLSATLVPIFVEHRDRDDDEATSAVVSVAAVVLVTLTVIGILAAPAIVRLYTLRVEGGAADAQQELATTLLRLFMPQMLFYGLVAMASALLHAHRRFAAPAFVPILNNVVVAGVFLALGRVVEGTPSLDEVRHDTGLVLLLGVGTTAGIVAMGLALLPALRRTGVRLRPVLAWNHPAVRKVVALSGWTAGYVASNQLALWVVLVLANESAGGVSAYQAAFVFFQLPHGLVAVSLMTTIAPDLAGAATRGDLGAFRERFDLGARLMVLAVLPAAAGYLVLSRPIVGFLLERGALSGAAADLTADCLAAFAFGLVPFSVYLFALRGFYATHDTRTPFLLNAMENGLNIGLALALSPWLGVRGLAYAYAGAYAVAAVAAVAALRRRTGQPLTADRAAFTRPLAAAAVMVAAVRLVTSALPGTLSDGVVVVVGVAVGAVTYGAALAAFGVPQAAEALSRLRRR